jgi:aminoglycoside 2''-phosphotransferase
MQTQDTLALLKDQQFSVMAEHAIHLYCPDVHEITYIQHGADNLIALVNRELTFRFPRNEHAALRLSYETALLQKLAGRIKSIPIPQIAHIGHQPLFVVAKYIEGDHLTPAEVQALNAEEQEAIGQKIAQFIVELNQAISGLEVQRLRVEAKVHELEEPWAPHFERLFVGEPLPNTTLQPIVQHYYQLWQDNVRSEYSNHAIHDDLHPVNLLFTGPKLSGILDFGDANMGSIESELRWLYAMGEPVLQAALNEYHRLTGELPNVEHIKVWAIMHELSSFVERLTKGQTDQFPFIRAQSNLRAWVPNFPM